VDPLLARRLPRLRAALRPVTRPDEVLRLQYAVDSFDGDWRWDVVVGDRIYAEQRVRADGASRYAFGDDDSGVWLQVDGAPVRAAEPHWRREARTRAALFGMRFLSPALGEEAVYLGDDGDGWEYAFRAAGGRTLNLKIEERSGQPVAFDLLDGFGRLALCEEIEWTEREGRMVPASGTCGSINGRGHRRYEWRFTLRGATVASVAAGLPPWASVRAPRPELVRDVEVEVALTRDDRVELPVSGAETDAPALAPMFTLDSGADRTVVGEHVAEELGVVPTGDAPIYYEPPWLPSGNDWVGVADRLTVSGIDLDGPLLLVAQGPMGTDGLLGHDFFKRWVIDLDTPRRRLRLVPPASYVASADAVPVYASTRHRVPVITAEVPDVARGDLLVDTGATFPVFVAATRFLASHPRHEGTDAYLGALVDDDSSPDYWTDVPGLLMGPFRLPAMPAVARDRMRDRVGGLGIVGMGALRHFRVGFDLRQSRLLMEPGDGYVVIHRLGLVIDGAGTETPWVSWVVPESHAASALIQQGDEILSIDGISVRDALEARARIAGATGSRIRLRLRRGERTRTITLAIDPPPARER
jgi:hypothetical protein